MFIQSLKPSPKTETTPDTNQTKREETSSPGLDTGDCRYLCLPSIPTTASCHRVATCNHLALDQLWHLSSCLFPISSQDFGFSWQNIYIEVKRYMGTGLREMCVLRHLQAKQRVVTSSPRLLPWDLSPLLSWTKEGHQYATNATNWTWSAKNFKRFQTATVFVSIPEDVNATICERMKELNLLSQTDRWEQFWIKRNWKG